MNERTRFNNYLVPEGNNGPGQSIPAPVGQLREQWKKLAVS